MIWVDMIINHVSYCLLSLFETSIREVEHENPSGTSAPNIAQFFASTKLNRDVKNHDGNITNTYPSRCRVMPPVVSPEGASTAVYPQQRGRSQGALQGWWPGLFVKPHQWPEPGNNCRIAHSQYAAPEGSWFEMADIAKWVSGDVDWCS